MTQLMSDGGGLNWVQMLQNPLAWTRAVQDSVTQTAVGNSEFRLDVVKFKQNYADLRAAYDQLVEKRRDIENQARSVAASSVAPRIRGVAMAAEAARKAVGIDTSNSMTVTLRKHEIDLAKTLNNLAAAWDAYLAADYEAMNTFVEAARTGSGGGSGGLMQVQ